MPQPIYLLIGYFFLIIFSIFSWRRRFQKKEKEASDYLLLVWPVLIPIMAYLDWQFQRRLLMGWQIVLAILTVDQIEFWLINKKKSLSYILQNKILFTYLFIFMFSSAALLLPFKEMATLDYIKNIRPDAYTFNRSEIAEIAKYLHDNNSDRLPLLSPPIESTYIVAYGLQRVYCCRSQETIDYEAKKQKVINFYLNKNSDGQELIWANGIRYILMPKIYDREGWPQGGPFGWEVVFETENYKLYRIVGSL